MEIYKHAYKLIKKNIMGRKLFTLVISMFLLASTASGASEILLNGTSLFIASGDSYGLYQGYIIKIRSVSNEGSTWLELTSNDTYVKSEIVRINGLFTYNKTNRTILSLRVDNIYSGSNDENLVSFFPVYQYLDPELPAPEILEITPIETTVPEKNNSTQEQQAVPETVMIAIGLIFILFMLYIIRKLW